jgi:RNA polymerase sigma factor (sigma-70 family)
VEEIQVVQGDEIAIARARSGDRDAFRVLVERHSRVLFRLAFRMTGNEIDAEDMVQETFLKAWKQIGKFDGRASFATWLHRICANCSLDHIRACKRKQELQPISRQDSSGDAVDPMAQVATQLANHCDSASRARRIERDGAGGFHSATLRGHGHRGNIGHARRSAWRG